MVEELYETENDRHAAYSIEINRPLMSPEEAMLRIKRVREFASRGLSKMTLEGGEVHPYIYSTNG